MADIASINQARSLFEAFKLKLGPKFSQLEANPFIAGWSEFEKSLQFNWFLYLVVFIAILIGGISPKDGLSMDNLKKWCGNLDLMTSGTKSELIARITNHYDKLTSRNSESEDLRELWYEHYERFAARDREFLRAQQLIDKDLEMEARFEDATNFLFEVKLGHKPLKMVATEHADGMLSHGDSLILWDNKSKETDVNLGSHIKQFFSIRSIHASDIHGWNHPSC